MRRVLPFLAAIALSACAATYKQQVGTAPTAKLERGAPVLIATPKNGSYGKKEYETSGLETATVVRSAFAKVSDRAVVSSNCADLPCLQSEGAGAYTYFVIPEIRHWEDRNTQWSGIPDEIEVKLAIVDARTNTELASTVISAKSRRVTTVGGRPQDLLPKPVKQYVDGLY